MKVVHATPASPVTHDVWERIKQEAAVAVAQEPVLASYIHAAILSQRSFQESLRYVLAERLAGAEVSSMQLREMFAVAHHDDAALSQKAAEDLNAIVARDPATKEIMTALLYYKGFHALQAWRIAHWLWLKGRRHLAFYLQGRISERFAVDIHPGATIGSGIMMDHATGIVIGETAVVDDNVSFLHNVTLGGTGKESGDRHPKIRAGVMLGAGSKILGNIVVGECARIAAGSVVLKDVPARATMAGVPARQVGSVGDSEPAQDMNQIVDCDIRL